MNCPKACGAALDLRRALCWLLVTGKKIAIDYDRSGALFRVTVSGRHVTTTWIGEQPCRVLAEAAKAWGCNLGN